MSTGRPPVPEDVLLFLEALWRPGEVREVRIPRWDGYKTASGYFDAPEKLARAAASWEGKANIYVTLNPGNPALLARAKNRIVPKTALATADTDIIQRRWLFLDIDSVRPAGVSATEEELGAAKALLDTVTFALTLEGWPDPLTCLSGNGCYALYPLDLPSTPDTRDLVQGVLTYLHQTNSSEYAKIDTAVANAGRIIGLVGTTKMKGDNLPERPHRRSRLLSAPEALVVVEEEHLRALADKVAPRATASPPRRTPGTTPRAAEPLKDILDRHGLDYREQPADASGITWYHLRRCPFHDDGRDYECGVGQKLPDGPYAGHCFHPEGAGRGWQEWKRALGLEVGRERHDRVMVGTKNEDTSTLTFPRTDAGNGELFAHLYQDEVRYDHRLHRYLLFSGDRWREDAQAQIRVLAKKAARYRLHLAAEMSDDAQRQAEKTYARQSENKQRLEAMLLLGQSEDPIADDGEHWDEDPTLLGVENGVLDLALGRLRAGRPEDRITLHTPIPFDPVASCPRFERFLAEIFEGNLSLIDFTGRATGYSLTAHTHEQAFFFCSGVGANGKGVLFSVLRLLLGDYAQNLPFQSLEQQSRGGIPNDIASIVNRRLVTVAETNRGSKLDEALLKTLTGEDVVTARFMRKEYFNFVPVAKFWLAANHKPDIKDLSYGFWRRIMVVPFSRVFAKHERDPHLLGQLKEELPGILAWAVRGCAAWQRRGLDPPDEVRVATEEYRLEVDSVGRFIAEACLVAPEESSLAGPLYSAYRRWAEDEGLDGDAVLDKNSFGSAMKMRFQRKESNRGRLYQGIGVRPL